VSDRETGRLWDERDGVAENADGERGSELAFFSGIPEQEHRLLIDTATLIRREKGAQLFAEGQRADTVWVIQSGRVKLSHVTADGDEQIIGIFSREEAIWEGIFLRDSMYPYSAVCVSDVTVYAIDARKFLRLLHERVSISVAILTLLSRKLHDANARNRILSTKDPAERIAGLLLYHAERSDSPIIALKLEDMAASLNLRPETVSRKARQMEADGLIERAGKGKIRVVDYDGLRRMYEGEMPG